MRKVGERQIYVWWDGDSQDRAWVVSLDEPNDDGAAVVTQALAVVFNRRDAIEVARREATRRGLGIAVED